MSKGQRIKAQRAAGQAAASSRSRGTRPGHVDSRRPIPWFAITVGVIVVAALAALLWPADNKHAAPAFKHAAYSHVSLDSTPALARFSTSYMEQAAADPAVGAPTPRATGQSPAGARVGIGGPAAQPTMLIFLAHWCPHCQREVPRLQAWLDSHGMPNDVAITAIATASTSSRPNFPPAAWLDRENWTAPVLLDDEVGSAGIAYGVDTYPYFVLVGADGRVIRRGSGELTTAAWESYINQLRATAR